jgi:hypothetical protein
VLKHYWAGLDEATREALGATVPIFLEHYLVTDRLTAPAVAMLRSAGIEADAAERTARDTFTPIVRSEHRMGRNIMRLLDQSGLLAHPPTREALVRAEWIAA